MNRREAAALIDISAVRTESTWNDIKSLVELAEKYHFINVHVLPNWVSALADMLKDIDGVYVGSPVGFPSGAHTTEVKLLEAKKLIEDGVEEMDIMMNVGRFKDKEYDYVKNELKSIIALAKESDRKIMTKVLIEINALSDDEMLRACDLVMECGADFIKTGTGWIAGGANIERVRKIKAHCGNRIKVKAAGGIRTRKDFDELIGMGVERLGINTKSAMEILETLPEM